MWLTVKKNLIGSFTRFIHIAWLQTGVVMIVQLLHIWMCWLELDRMVLVQVYNHKVDDFSFPVVLYIFPGGNVPIKMGYNVCSSQLLRFAKKIQ